MLRIYTGQNGHLATIGSFQEPEALGALWLDLLNPTAEGVKLVEAHLGIATLPDYLVERESGLVQVDLPLEAPAFDTYFVYPEELKESKRVAVFRDFIVSKAKEWKY